MLRFFRWFGRDRPAALRFFCSDMWKPWIYRPVDWADAFLDVWCVQAMRSRIEPSKKMAHRLRRHSPLSLNAFPRARADFRCLRSGKSPANSAEDQFINDTWATVASLLRCGS